MLTVLRDRSQAGRLVPDGDLPPGPAGRFLQRRSASGRALPGFIGLAAGEERGLEPEPQVAGSSSGDRGPPLFVDEEACHAILNRRSGVTAPHLLHGEQAAYRPLVRHAGRLGLPTRTGLEDTAAGPYGQPVSGNAELVRLALAAWTAAQP